MTKRIKIVCGPTASGKSARAIDIAQAEKGVIINADAMQIYRELRILTARPSLADEAAVAHLLYGVLPAEEACSAGRWLKLACEAIDATLKSAKLPIVTGGTGLYIKSLMQGIAEIPDIPDAAREQAQDLWKEQGPTALLERDPETASRLKHGDTQRHIRALEVWIATGKSLTYWQEQGRKPPYPDAEFDIEYVDVARNVLYERCDARFLHMINAGALEEAKALNTLNLSSALPAMRAVGVPELLAYLSGKIPLEEAIKKSQQATRNYAKRQITWFKHQLLNHPGV